MRRTQILIFGLITLSAATLAVFSSRSLSSQEILLREAAAETRRVAAREAAGRWSAALEAAAAARLPDSPAPATLSSLESRPEVAAAFAVDRLGRLVWPPQPEPEPHVFVEEFPGDGSARAMLREGYRLEFEAKDTAGALRAYAQAGDARYGRTVRGKAKMQEGALAAKLGQADVGISAYGDVLSMSAFVDPDQVYLAWVQRAKLLQTLGNVQVPEKEYLRLYEATLAADAWKSGAAAERARAAAIRELALLEMTPDGAARLGELNARAERQAAQAAAREAAAEAFLSAQRTRSDAARAALPGGLLAAWRPRPGGGATGVLLRAGSLGLSGDGALAAGGASWLGTLDPKSLTYPVPGIDGLLVALPIGDAGAAGIARQKALYFAGLCLLIGAIAGGLFISFRAVRREADLARLKSDFVANVSHELKTPLALVRMYAETLALGRISDPGQRREYETVILREAERLSSMIERILDFARIERGERAYHPVPVDLAALARDAAATFTSHTQIPVTLHAPDPIPATADPDAVATALRNLLENAARYSEGAPSIELRAASASGFSTLTVADRGIGVPPADRSRIFERFVRSTDPRVRKVKGTGLGLALVAHIMQGHGGTARALPREGGGSLFILSFPRRTAHAPIDDPGGGGRSGPLARREGQPVVRGVPGADGGGR